jgi:hypothetical protein
MFMLVRSLASPHKKNTSALKKNFDFSGPRAVPSRPRPGRFAFLQPFSLSFLVQNLLLDSSNNPDSATVNGNTGITDLLGLPLGKSGGEIVVKTKVLNASDITIGGVTVADGADVAEGAVGDAVVDAGASGTLSAKLRRLTTDLAQILPASTAAAVTPSDSTALVSRAVWVGGAGDLSVRLSGASSTTVVFTAVPAGSLLPISVVRVMAATTATNINVLA